MALYLVLHFFKNILMTIIFIQSFLKCNDHITTDLNAVISSCKEDGITKGEKTSLKIVIICTTCKLPKIVYNIRHFHCTFFF